MCGCGSGGISRVNSTNCSGKTSDLHIIRNSLITLEKFTKDLVKKQEYKDLRTQVEEMLKNTTTCPDLVTIISLKEYITSEQSINNN